MQVDPFCLFKNEAIISSGDFFLHEVVNVLTGVMSNIDFLTEELHNLTKDLEKYLQLLDALDVIIKDSWRGCLEHNLVKIELLVQEMLTTIVTCEEIARNEEVQGCVLVGINRILSLISLYADKWPIDTVGIREVLSDHEMLFRSFRFLYPGISICLDVQSSKKVVISREAVMTVVINLLKNALDASKCGQQVFVIVRDVKML